MKSVLHKANTRGSADHGWLKVNHTFSFASYQNPERMHFGVLRVLNDDTIAGGKGFGAHPHDNMEIITIPLEGALQHKDNMGNSSIIQSGDIQVMSAGTGVVHSEFNPSEVDESKVLQIWMFPREQNVTPRYDQLSIGHLEKNHLKQILSPLPEDPGVWIHQDAWFHLLETDAESIVDYEVRRKGNGVYAFLIDGALAIGDEELNRRDGIGIWDTDSFIIKSKVASKVLLMDIPMSLN